MLVEHGNALTCCICYTLQKLLQLSDGHGTCSPFLAIRLKLVDFFTKDFLWFFVKCWGARFSESLSPVYAALCQMEKGCWKSSCNMWVTLRTTKRCAKNKRILLMTKDGETYGQLGDAKNSSPSKLRKPPRVFPPRFVCFQLPFRDHSFKRTASKLENFVYLNPPVGWLKFHPPLKQTRLGAEIWHPKGGYRYIKSSLAAWWIVQETTP